MGEVEAVVGFEEIIGAHDANSPDRAARDFFMGNED